ncbi:zinc-RING finger domain, partial [Rhizoctonia solani]
MSYCRICETECTDITRHLFSYHARSQAVDSGIATSAGPSSNEPEPSAPDDDQAFCFQCSRNFHTVAALTAHLGDAQVHDRNTGYTAHMSLGMPGYPPHAHNATGSYSLYPRSPRPSSDLGYDYGDSGSGDAGSSPQTSSSLLGGSSTLSDSPINEPGREYTPEDDQMLSHDVSHLTSTFECWWTEYTHSIRQSSDFSDELASENDEAGNMPIDTEHQDSHNHLDSTPALALDHTQHFRSPDSVAGGAQPPSLPYAPGAYAFIPPHPNIPLPGMNAYVQEGMSMSYPYPKSVLTAGTSYCHRSGATHRPEVYRAESSSNSTHPPTPRIMCPICLDPAQEITSTLCGHIFCASCIKSALSLREACPVCNRAISRWSTHPIYPVF